MEHPAGFVGVAFCLQTAVYAVVDCLDNKRFPVLLFSREMKGSRRSSSASHHAGQSSFSITAVDNVRHGHGSVLARAVARQLVVYHRRTGGQTQFSVLLELEPKSDRIQRALGHARHNLRNSLSVEELAKAANLSTRQFSRSFRAETGESPAKAVERLRVEAARLMMEEGKHSMDVIAGQTGFIDRDRMRRAFLRVLGQPPHLVRRIARAASKSLNVDES